MLSAKGRAIGALLVAMVACVFVVGLVVTPPPGDTAPSAVKKLYDPTDL